MLRVRGIKELNDIITPTREMVDREIRHRKNCDTEWMARMKKQLGKLKQEKRLARRKK